jgi:HK97 family phage major capsid protein
MSGTVKLDDVIVQNQKNAEGIAALSKSINTLVDVVKKTPANGTPSASEVFGLPNARTGEDPMTSRGFSFAKMIGVISGAIEPSEAKVEINDVHGKLHSALVADRGSGGFAYRGAGQTGHNRFLAPLCTKYLPDTWIDRNVRHEIKSLVSAGMDNVDQGEMQWIRTKQLQGMGYNKKTLSWLNDNLGGALVAPPEFGELIELLRNKEACVNAGAKTVPLPPQGRIVYPRQTAASNAYWVGENQPITDSDVGTGEVTLQAKKLAVLIKAPNELIRFASPAAEALIRDDMTKTMALALDLACLEGTGGNNTPEGLITKQFINRINSSTQGVDGDTLIGQDVYRMIAAVEESNAEYEGFLMRPKTLYKFYQLRAASVSAGDNAGPFLFNLIREASDGTIPMLAGYPVTKSTQVSQSRQKGASSNLTYIIGGMWSDMLIGMFGALEFAATTMGDTAFTRDQTWVRGILSADMAVRHESAFCMLDSLSTTL